MSGAPIIMGIIQLARPTNAGMAKRDHDQRVHGGHLIEEMRSTNCRPAARARYGSRATSATDDGHDESEHQVQGAMSLWFVVNNQR